jgi:hypothetical protein
VKKLALVIRTAGLVIGRGVTLAVQHIQCRLSLSGDLFGRHNLTVP